MWNDLLALLISLSKSPFDHNRPLSSEEKEEEESEKNVQTQKITKLRTVQCPKKSRK